MLFIRMNEETNIHRCDELLPPDRTRLPGALVEAYLATTYQVHPTSSTPGFTLRVGQACPELAALMRRFNRQSAAFITAWNPLGNVLSDGENRARNETLRQVLEQRSLLHWAGIGMGLTGEWPGEESFLVLGLDLQAARRLAQDVEQNAFVWAGANCTPELVLLV